MFVYVRRTLLRVGSNTNSIAFVALRSKLLNRAMLVVNLVDIVLYYYTVSIVFFKFPDLAVLNDSRVSNTPIILWPCMFKIIGKTPFQMFYDVFAGSTT